MINVDAAIQAGSSGGSPDDAKRIKDLEKQIEELEQKLHRHRKPRIRISGDRATPAEDADFVRVIIPDTHGCFVDQQAISAVLSDLRILQPAEIVMLGDHLDCGGFLAEHHTLGFVADADYSYEEDIDAANDLLDQIQSVAPTARIDYLYGNHEERIERYAITKIRSQSDAERFRRQNSPEHVLSLETRGIKWYRSNQRYDDLPTPGTIRRGHCYFTHGHKHGRHAAADHLRQFAGNLVFGHIHRIQSCAGRTVHGGTAASWSVGCLCQLQPSYRNRDYTDWCHGYGVQFCRADGSFLHITIHVIDGVSFLQPLLQVAGIG